MLVGHSGVGQVDAGERPRAGRRARGRQRQPGDRPGPAHVLVRGRAAAGRTTDGWIIDTPGLRSFGLAHVAARQRRCRRFPEFAGRAGRVPARLQPHRGRLRARGLGRRARWSRAAARLDSLRRLLRSREGLDPVDTADRGQLTAPARRASPARRRAAAAPQSAAGRWCRRRCPGPAAGSPARSVNAPPASSTMICSAARSHSVTSVSAETSTRPRRPARATRSLRRRGSATPCG